MLIFQRKSRWLVIQLSLMFIGLVFLALTLLTEFRRDLLILKIYRGGLRLLADPYESVLWREIYWAFGESVFEGILVFLFIAGFLLHPLAFLISCFLILTRFQIFRRLIGTLDFIYAVIIVIAAFTVMRLHIIHVFYFLAYVIIATALWLPVYKEKVDVDAIIAEASAC